MKKTRSKVGLLFDFILLIGLILFILLYRPNVNHNKNFLYIKTHVTEKDGVLFNPFIDSIKPIQKHTLNEQQSTDTK